MAYVVLRNGEPKHGWHVLEVAKPWPGALPARLFDGPGAGGALVARKTGGPSTKKKPVLALQVIDDAGAIVVHADVAEALPKAWHQGTVAVPYRPKGKPAVDGYVLVRVDVYAPLDRTTSELELDDDAAPLVGHVRGIEKLAFADEATLPPMFRLADAPGVIVARADVAAKLVELTGGDLRAANGLGDTQLPPEDARVTPVDVDERKARAAHEALWRARAGDAAACTATLVHPHCALAQALGKDGGPRDDTRAAALRHPYTAAMYALHVDRAARDDTRAAARRDAHAAVVYAHEVDLATDGEVLGLMKTLVDFWDADTIEGFQESVDERRAAHRGAGQASRPKAVATKVEAKAVPRHREAADRKRKIAPLSAELRTDVEEMTARGLAELGLAADAPPSLVVDAVHAAVDAIRSGERKLPRGKAAGTLRLMLACAFADALHRGCGWQWAAVGDDGVASVVSPDGAHGVVPLAPILRTAKKGARANTIALLFNMIVGGDLPPAQARAVSFVS